MGRIAARRGFLIMKPAIAYIRVSTQAQGKSGLGVEAQLAAIKAFCAAEGFEIARTFTEVETGKGADALDKRPQLAAALGAAKTVKAVYGDPCPVIVAIIGAILQRTP